jgi:signal transduction histidine kinase/CheY-like chemotaxis protein
MSFKVEGVAQNLAQLMAIKAISGEEISLEQSGNGMMIELQKLLKLTDVNFLKLTLYGHDEKSRDAATPRENVLKDINTPKKWSVTIYITNRAEVFFNSVDKRPDGLIAKLDISFGDSKPLINTQGLIFLTLALFLFVMFFVYYLVQHSVARYVLKPVSEIRDSMNEMTNLVENSQSKRGIGEKAKYKKIEFNNHENEELYETVNAFNRLQAHYATLIEKMREAGRDLSKQLMETQAERKKQEDLIISLSHDIRQPVETVKVAMDMSKKWFFEDGNIQKRNDLFRLYAYINSLTMKAQNILDNGVYIHDRNSIQFNSELKDLKIFELATSPDSIGLFPFEAQTKGIRFSIDFNGLENHIVRLAKVRFERVLTNLCSNAIRYTGKGGEIKVKFEGVEPDVVGGLHKIVFSVEDNGKGMSEEMLNKVNRPDGKNYRNPESETSLGFGVLNCYQNLSGGTMRFDSKPGKSTKVKVEFPCYLVGEDKPNYRRKSIYWGEGFSIVAPLIREYFDTEVVELTGEDWSNIRADMIFLRDCFKVQDGKLKPNIEKYPREVFSKLNELRKRLGLGFIALQSEYDDCMVEDVAYLKDIRSIPELYLKKLLVERGRAKSELCDQTKQYLAGKRILIVDDAHEYASILRRNTLSALEPYELKVDIVYSKEEAKEYVQKSLGQGKVIDYAFVDRMLGDDKGEDALEEISSLYANERIRSPKFIGFSAAEHKLDGKSKYDAFFQKDSDALSGALKFIREKNW